MAGWIASYEWRNGNTALLNESLARQLNAREGDEIIVRISKPSALGLDAALSPKSENTVSLRVKVGKTIGSHMLGDFALAPGAAPPANLFLPYATVSRAVKLQQEANLMLMGSVVDLSHQRNAWLGAPRSAIAQWLVRWAPRKKTPGGRPNPYLADPGSTPARLARGITPQPRHDSVQTARANNMLDSAIGSKWTLEDAQLSVGRFEEPQSITGGEFIRPYIEISSPRIFL